jgi:hypothetical protein
MGNQQPSLLRDERKVQSLEAESRTDSNASTSAQILVRPVPRNLKRLAKFSLESFISGFKLDSYN